MRKYLLIISVVVVLLTGSVQAATDRIAVNIHYWPQVYHGAGQSYNVKITGHASGVYVVLSLHPDTEIIGVNHTGNIQCHSIEDDGTTVLCYVSRLDGDVVVGVHGSIRGRGDNGIYGVLRVGTLSEGSPGRGWVLNADYRARGGTIPSAIAPEPEPNSNKIFLPIVEG